MKKYTTYLHTLIIALGGLAQSCSDEGAVPTTTSGDWLIPATRVFDGGPGKDGIPALQNPEFIPVGEVQFLASNDLVLGIQVGDQLRAYAHPILDWHEIINDEIGNEHFAVTYCPLTGTGIGWNRVINGQETTFGVSGLLFNTNLIPYDRATDSNWSQMLQQSINGTLIGEKPEFVHLVETTWATWREMFPNSVVTSLNTGISRNYGQYPYGDYRTSENVIFPVENEDMTLPAKERVLGVDINDERKAFRFELFTDRDIVTATVGGEEIVVIGDSDDNFMVAFRDTFLEAQLPLTVVDDGSSAVLADATGNQYDVFGKVVSGPDTGVSLTPVNAYIGYWFAWAAFFPNVELVSSPN